MKNLREYVAMFDPDKGRETSFKLITALLIDAAKNPCGGNEELFRRLDRANGLWKQVAARFSRHLKPGGLKAFVEIEMPDVYRGWVAHNSRKRLRRRIGR